MQPENNFPTPNHVENKEQLNIDSVIQAFRAHFSKAQYKEIKPVKISSGIDPTVRFIGSHISVFKPYFLEKKLPEDGIFMQQDCIRTHNTKKSIDDTNLIKWGSHFPSIGAMVKYDQLEKIVADSLIFLSNSLSIPTNEIKLLISSQDKDLLEASQAVCEKEITLEIDTKPLAYYRHKLGIEGVRGRNFNLAIKNQSTGLYSDVGNIIVIENEEEKLGVELALGVTTILKELKNLDHIMDSYPFSSKKQESIDEVASRKLEDSIVVATTLFREGLRPFGSGNRNRILKTYLKSMLYQKLVLGLNRQQLQDKMQDFETKYFEDKDNQNMVSNLITEYLTAYANEIKYKKHLSKDDLLILNLINKQNN